MNGSQGKSYRVGVIGFAHMHVNELVDRFAATGRSPIVACADTVPRMPSLTRVEGSRKANLGRALALPSDPRRYEDYRELLAAERLDIVILCPENARHSEIAQEVAERRRPCGSGKTDGGHSRRRALNGGRREEVWCHACGQLADCLVASV